MQAGWLRFYKGSDMAKRDFYEVLGVERNAGAEDIKKAYRRKAKELHPDRNSDNPNAEAQFKEVNEAYDALKDPERKAAYDRFGHAAFDGGMGGGPRGGPRGGRGGGGRADLGRFRPQQRRRTSERSDSGAPPPAAQAPRLPRGGPPWSPPGHRGSLSRDIATPPTRSVGT